MRNRQRGAARTERAERGSESTFAGSRCGPQCGVWGDVFVLAQSTCGEPRLTLFDRRGDVKEKKLPASATIIDFCEFLVIDSIARGTQRLNCSMRGSMAMELHIEQLSR